MDFKDFKFWKPPQDETPVFRLVGKPVNFRQYYIDPRREAETFLNTDTFFNRYEVTGNVETVEDRPDCTCERCEKRRANGMGPIQRYLLPVIDIETQKQLMISVPMTARQALVKIVELFRQIEETARLVQSQQAAARRFKTMKMFYGAKR